ncbi:MAG: cytochrome c biogenesis CcdA family protein [Planctomycetota bacterium]|jgi:cytochrome c biogenesis protein CcdA
MQERINHTLETPTFSLAVLLAAFLLGLVSSIASACCNLPVFGAIVGYSGRRKETSSGATLFGAGFFILGTTIAIIILGSVAGFIGQIAQSTLGSYWKLFAGLIAIFFGLAVLKLLPLNLSLKTLQSKTEPKGFLASAVFGLVIGGAISVCSLCCNPGIFIVLAVVVLQDYNLWAVTILAVYAIGFSLPLATIMLGVSFGTMAIKARKIETAIRIIAGICLVAAGFYFLATL